jgi:hypothetical protein
VFPSISDFLEDAFLRSPNARKLLESVPFLDCSNPFMLFLTSSAPRRGRGAHAMECWIEFVDGSPQAAVAPKAIAISMNDRLVILVITSLSRRTVVSGDRTASSLQPGNLKA